MGTRLRLKELVVSFKMFYSSYYYFFIIFTVVTVPLQCWATASFRCEYYNATCVREAGSMSSSSCMGVQVCSDHQEHLCYVVWSPGKRSEKNDTNMLVSSKHSSGHEVHLMGCMPRDNSHKCEHRDQCIETNDKRNPFFCCCSSPMCNNVFVVNAATSTTEATPRGSAPLGEDGEDEVDDDNHNVWLLILLIVFLCLLMVSLISALLLLLRSRSKHYGSFVSVNNEQNGNDSKEQAFGMASKFIDKELQKEDLICGKGQFGVYKGRIVASNDVVAIKIFNVHQRASWIAEQEVYNLPRMSHNAILHFVGVLTRNFDNEQPELWLVTQYHEKGSLCDFLHCHTLSFMDLCRLGHSMMSGLAHLHEELPQVDMMDLKPAVAHRDFKSKNVLIKSDLTACICDFGLALIFEPGKACGDEYGQVGTPRYMAPEMLEGSIYFTRESFLRIDMYACGLVLWELASRCKDPNLEQPLEYRLPFQELEEHPTLEQMLNLVVNRQERPSLRPSWESGVHRGMSELSQTITQCWDQDSEARLSASNVRQRLHNLLKWAQSQDQVGDERSDSLLTEYEANNEAQDGIEMRPLVSQPSPLR